MNKWAKWILALTLLGIVGVVALYEYDAGPATSSSGGRSDDSRYQNLR